MAGQRGPTAVHIITILFGMASLILAVTTFISYREYSRVSVEVLDESTSLATTRSQLQRALADTRNLNAAIGAPGLEVGDEADDATSLGYFTKVMNDYGGDQQQQTFRATLAEMRNRINSLESAIAQSQAQLDASVATLQAAEGEGQARIDGYRGDQDMAEDDLVRRINDHAEELAGLEVRIDELRAELQREQQEKEGLREQLDLLREEGNREIALLDERIAALLDELNRLKEVAFDVPHGHIIRVENITQLVYVDIGSSDLLRPGVAFNVYVQNPRDVGRGAQDIKGSIEIVRILSATQAEARVLSEDHSRPIAAGDPIYSPIWRAGVVHEYAFVGIMDLDGDGSSDWEDIRELVELEDGRVAFYVDDAGNRQPSTGGITGRTKFLVVGEIPNPDDFFGDPERQEAAAQIQTEHARLTTDALRYGVRVLRKNDFLTHIEWKPDLSATRQELTDATGTQAVRDLLDTEPLPLEP